MGENPPGLFAVADEDDDDIMSLSESGSSASVSVDEATMDQRLACIEFQRARLRANEKFARGLNAVPYLWFWLCSLYVLVGGVLIAL